MSLESIISTRVGVFFDSPKKVKEFDIILSTEFEVVEQIRSQCSTTSNKKYVRVVFPNHSSTPRLDIFCYTIQFQGGWHRDGLFVDAARSVNIWNEHA